MNRLKKKIIISLVAGLIGFGIYGEIANKNSVEIEAKENIQTQIAQKILRFHVLGNSDSEADQEVKIKVRDAVGKYIEPKLEESKDINTTRNIVNENMDGIIETANNVLKENGFSYKATGRIKNTDFPEKTYGQYTFPEGEYEALQIVLGEGKGHNWWCVLYPNMCFKGSVYEESDNEDENLKEVLTTDEYKEVFNTGKFAIKFKFLEYFKF